MSKKGADPFSGGSIAASVCFVIALISMIAASYGMGKNSDSKGKGGYQVSIGFAATGVALLLSAMFMFRFVE